MPPPKEYPEYNHLVVCHLKVTQLIENAGEPDPEQETAPYEEAMTEAREAIAAIVESRKGKGKADAIEEDLGEKLNQVQEIITKIQAAKKAAKDAARKALNAVVATAMPYTGDMEALKAALADAEEQGVSEKELNDAREKLTVMISFTFKLREGAKDLTEAATGKATMIRINKLEEIITEAKDDSVAALKKVECELWMQALTKVTATNVATEELDVALEEAKTLGLEEAMWKPIKKKNDEAKKAQNAKKIADRKAKKPPADPPKPPDRPEPSEQVNTLRSPPWERMYEM